MANFFNVTDRKDLNGVLFTRIADPATLAQGEAVYLDADPANGTWQPLPDVCKKIDTTGITNKIAILVPYK